MSNLTDNADELNKALTACLFNPRMADEVTEAILRLDRSTRLFVFERVVSVAKTQPEIAYQFALQAKHAITLHGREACEHWLQKSLDRFFSNDLHAALQVMKDLDGFILEYWQRQKGLQLDEVRGILQNMVNGLGGPALDIEAGSETYTDSERLYLPVVIDYFDDKIRNFAAYRAILTHLWAQNYYGTWRKNLKPEIKNNPDLLSRFHYLETLRLNACIKRDFPGLWRQMDQLSDSKIEAKSSWLEIEKKLSAGNTSVSDSIGLLTSIEDLPLPKPFWYQGTLKPDSVEKRQSQRLLREKNQLQLELAKIPDQQNTLGNEESSEKPEYVLNQLHSTKRTNTGFGINLDGVASPADNRTYVYPEWDNNLKTHRKQWCVLREKTITADYSSNFVSETLHKYRGHMKTLRRSFEALRDEYKILKKQPEGENLDIDALVEAISDVRSGMEMTTRVYRKASRVERNIAVVFMVDMSSSTRGWINLAQREALVLLTEALRSLDDRYAIYGFSGMTRKRCQLYTIKTFDEVYSEETKARISAIQPQEYTRMGVTIRHLTTLLDTINARTKLLITLSDGKPDDFDSYRGEYGIEDTRMALLEARQKGIHPFCITIDEQARDYLPHMYGDSNYVVVDDVAKMPYRISEVYRGLTS